MAYKEKKHERAKDGQKVMKWRYIEKLRGLRGYRAVKIEDNGKKIIVVKKKK